MDCDGFSEEVCRFLEFIGIKGYEARAYLTLLSHGMETAPRLAAESGIPLPRIYDVLRSLLRKGLVEVKAGRPRYYKAIPPSIALKRYVELYIDRIRGLLGRVSTELEKYYQSAVAEEPSIWLTYSPEASAEKVKSLIEGMNIDGYASLDPVLLREFSKSLYRKLSSTPENLFSITIIRGVEPGLISDLMRLDNVMILRQPTGYIRMLDVDHKDGVLFSENYALFTREEELLMIIDDAYFYGYWRNAGMLKKFTVKRGNHYRTSHHWMILPLVIDALKQGLNPILKITGHWVKTGEPARVTVRAESVYRGVDDYRRTITGVTMDGERITIGGLGASVEDVSASMIEVIID